MASTLPTPGDCCSTCDDVVTTQVPGPAGADGSDGTAGSDGSDPYSVLGAGFTMPAEGATANATVDQSTWMTVGSVVGLQVASGSIVSYMLVTAIPAATTVTLKNLEVTASSEYTSNAAPGTVFPVGTHVVPGGVQGPAGTAAGAAPDDAEYVLITADASLPSAQVLDVLTTGWMHWDAMLDVIGTQTAISLTTDVTGTLPVANGGTGGATAAAARTALSVAKSGANSDITSISGLLTPLSIGQGGTGQSTKIPAFDALSPLTSTGDLITYAAGHNTRLAIGAAGKVLRSDGASPTWDDVDNTIIASTTYWVQIPQYFAFGIPYDNTIPQVGEGKEIASLAYTADSVANWLYIEALVQCASDAAEVVVLALFDNAGADAVAAAAAFETTAGKPMQISLKIVMHPVTATSRTYSLRIGTNSGGAMGINGFGGDGGLAGKLGCAGGTSLMGTFLRIMEKAV